jgi:hypothetical protein
MVFLIRANNYRGRAEGSEKLWGQYTYLPELNSALVK